MGGLSNFKCFSDEGEAGMLQMACLFCIMLANKRKISSSYFTFF